jgi:hypothetical protein
MKTVGIALYPDDPTCSAAIVTLGPEHREMLSRVFNFMWEAANELAWGPESPDSSPAAVAPPPMSRESSAQGTYGYSQSPDLKVRDFAYVKTTDPSAYAYPEPARDSYAYDYQSSTQSRGYVEPVVHSYNSIPSQPAYGSSARNSLDFAYNNVYPYASYNPAPPAHTIPTAADSNPHEETYVTRTASQEARARRARDAYMRDHEARARQAAEAREQEAREQEARAQRENSIVLDDVPMRYPTEATPASDMSAEAAVALGRQHRREVTKQMRTQELRAKRARALYLQRTYGQKSRNMILA